MKREAIKKWIWEHMHESIAETRLAVGKFWISWIRERSGNFPRLLQIVCFLNCFLCRQDLPDSLQCVCWNTADAIGMNRMTGACRFIK